MLAAWGRVVVRHRGPVLAAAAATLALSAAGLARGGTLVSGSIGATESARAQHLAETALHQPGDTSFELLFRSPGLSFDDATFHGALERAVRRLEADPRVLSVRSPYTKPAPVGERFVAADRRSALAVVTLRGDERQAARAYAGVRAAVDAAPLEVLATGQPAFVHDLDAVLARDLARAELLSVPLALLVLVLAFGGLLAALLPLVVGGLAVVGGIAAVQALSHAVEMAQYTVNVVSLVGMGVAVDYSLFITARFREELAGGAATADAVSRAMATAGRAVAFSGLAVAAGLAGLLFFEDSYLRSMGVAGIVVVALAVAYALTLLPALLATLGPRLGSAKARRAVPGAWSRLTRRVMRRPVAVLVPTLALLLLAGAPFLRLRLAAVEVSILPPDTEARRGWDALRVSFPAETANAILGVVEFPGEAFVPARVAALYDASRRVASLPGVVRVESVVDLTDRLDLDSYVYLASQAPEARPPELRQVLPSLANGNAALLRVITTGDAPGPDAVRLVHELRRDPKVGDGHLIVGGRTASDLDAASYIRARTPRAVGFVVVVIAIALFAALGSVLLPLKALVMNALSISASFGTLVWIFQDGHLSGLLGFTPRPLEPALPVLLFCLVFGLSMDYELLLLGRMREEYRRTKDNTAAVALGLERSAGLITSAAAIMVAVFAAFGAARVVVVQAMGIGLAVAVALDATVVRIVVVPATMRLFGKLNWWAPAGILRLRELFRVGPRPAPRRT